MRSGLYRSDRLNLVIGTIDNLPAIRTRWDKKQSNFGLRNVTVLLTPRGDLNRFRWLAAEHE
jgi:hypothetical protein